MSEEERFAMVLLLLIERDNAIGYSGAHTLNTVERMCRDALGLEGDE